MRVYPYGQVNGRIDVVLRHPGHGIRRVWKTRGYVQDLGGCVLSGPGDEEGDGGSKTLITGKV